MQWIFALKLTLLSWNTSTDVCSLETDISLSGYQEVLSWFYFQEADKIASGSSYKTLEFHNYVI